MWFRRIVTKITFTRFKRLICCKIEVISRNFTKKKTFFTLQEKQLLISASNNWRAARYMCHHPSKLPERQLKERKIQLSHFQICSLQIVKFSEKETSSLVRAGDNLPLRPRAPSSWVPVTPERRWHVRILLQSVKWNQTDRLLFRRGKKSLKLAIKVDLVIIWVKDNVQL